MFSSRPLTICWKSSFGNSRNMSVLKREVPLIKYTDLEKKIDLSQQIHDAFGADGMGIIAVSGVPNLEKLRKNLLPLANKFAFLPDQVKGKYVLDEAYYSFGWSHGKERLQGKPDYSKGSFYNNPQYNQPVDDPELIKNYPTFIHPNIWPTDEIPEMEPAFMSLGQRIVDVGLLLALQCDAYVQARCPVYEPKIHRIISSSRSCKGRLLHYYGLTEEDIKQKESEKDLETQFSNWCGWHNDHGSLTGLVQAMYMDDFGNEVENPDENAGLYVKNRYGEIIKASIPSGHLIFQIGETAQIHSGGILQATPHAVNGPKCTGLNRETMAVFMGPDWDEKMSVPEGMDSKKAGRVENLPPGVPTLHSRWNNDMDCGEFTQSTVSAYY